LFVLIAALGCATELGVSSARSALRADRIDEAVREIDKVAAQTPNDYEVQLLRGEAHARAALRHLAAQQEPEYVEHFETALASYTRASSFDPRQSEPHTGIAILFVHQGNLEGALEELRVARMLEPGNPMTYANLAQIYVYMGRVVRARSMIEQGRKLGLPPVYAETVEMLASWRQGDLVDARDLFDMANQDPDAMRDFLQSDPSVPADFKTFDEMAEYCCASETCGPNLGDACRHMELEARKREVAAETLRREQEAALESQRALRKVFGGQREIDIEAEEEQEERETTPAPSSEPPR
jgi:Flp pilus assembly protein TadD